jgi:hypothetical protein
MKIREILLWAATIALTGCASSLMKPAENQTLAAPPAGTSRVVFLRPSALGGAIQASVFDVTGGEPVFIGVSSTGTKVVHDTTPGPHRFMVVSEAADFMEASLAAGRTYYAVVTARMGAWKARFSLWPVKADPSADYSLQSRDLAKWVDGAKLVVNTPAGEQWFRDNLSSIRAKQDEYLAVWKQKTPADLAKRTLEERDGVAP